MLPFTIRQELAERRTKPDALWPNLHGLTHDELAYILDTFPIVRRKDEDQYGEYWTKRFEHYNELGCCLDWRVNSRIVHQPYGGFTKGAS